MRTSYHQDIFTERKRVNGNCNFLLYLSLCLSIPHPNVMLTWLMHSGNDGVIKSIFLWVKLRRANSWYYKRFTRITWEFGDLLNLILFFFFCSIHIHLQIFFNFTFHDHLCIQCERCGINCNRDRVTIWSNNVMF